MLISMLVKVSPLVNNARHSTIRANYRVKLGEIGGRGQLIGGATTAGNAVMVKTLGTKVDVKTYVEVGVLPTLRFEYDKLTEEIATIYKEVKGLSNSFTHMQARNQEEDKPDLVRIAKFN